MLHFIEFSGGMILGRDKTSKIDQSDNMVLDLFLAGLLTFFDRIFKQGLQNRLQFGRDVIDYASITERCCVQWETPKFGRN